MLPFVLLGLSAVLGPGSVLHAAEVARLDAENWDTLAPEGKEVDAVYGDWVLRNDEIVAVVGDTIDWRRANMTVRNVGGAVIDLTSVRNPNDQLSAFYSLPRSVVGGNPPANLTESEGRVDPDGTAVLLCRNRPTGRGPRVEVEYRLADGNSFLRVVTRVENTTDGPLELELRDEIRADYLFEGSVGGEGRLAWVENRWFPQAYGVVVKDGEKRLEMTSGDGRRPPWEIRYDRGNESTVTLAAGESFSLERLLFCAPDSATLRAAVAEHLGHPGRPARFTVEDPAGPVAEARVEIFVDGAAYAVGYTDESGHLETRLPFGSVGLRVESLGRGAMRKETGKPDGPVEAVVQMNEPGYAVAEILDAAGGPIPCKVQFIGKGDTPTPYFFHEAGEHMVHNVHYSHNGRFRQPLEPGNYEVIISYGPEHDAVFTEIRVRAGEETPLAATLKRVVDSRGGMSAELHSHSSPSGDNVASQRGRVLNLLAEHLEFAPCTEHNRIDSYQPHLEALGAERLMATVPGLELTRSPLPLNHQNAFPLIHRPRTQDGGGPATHADPVRQVERLRGWDDGADKLVQKNHPNIIQLFFDGQLDGKGDGAHREMLPHLDVIEIHPLHRILHSATVENGINTGGNRIHGWLLMLNQGMWLPGVVNTDAHWNFHGSGWRRNFIHTPEDDPAKVDVMDLVASLRKGRVVMSNGPFMQVAFHASAGGERGIPGDTVWAPRGRGQLHVRVQCSNWLDIDRVQVLVNGRAPGHLNFTRESHAAWFGNDVVKFQRAIPVEVEEDSHLIVVAIGESTTLGPVMGARRGSANPVAVSNPVFVDIDGSGFRPNGDTLGAPLPLVP